MDELTKIEQVKKKAAQWRCEGLSVGLVPTMGYLHEGHKSLIRHSVSENDRTVVSVFVNPMQFGPSEDLATYPRDKVRDDNACEESGADIVFRPETDEMYPEGFCSYVDMTGLTGTLCGRSRPGHFRGVCTVVSKLFGIVRPDRAYFGQKDAQQLAVVKRMTADLNLGVDVIGCPIVREADGLALSSRNTYLNPDERKAALCLSWSLLVARDIRISGETDPQVIKKAIADIVEAEPLARVDYIEIVNPDNMEPVAKIDAPVLAAMAVFIGGTRLIDNCLM
jgi:pantoate--beta-alanine ligase